MVIICEFLKDIGLEYEINKNTIKIASKKITIVVTDITEDLGFTESKVKSLIKEYKEDDYSVVMFYSDELLNKQSLCISMLRSKLGIKSDYIYRASALEFKLITKASTYKDFFDTNHIDGFVQASFIYGLFDGETPITMMSFRQSTHDNCLEIARFCSKINTTVHGAFSKFMGEFPKDKPLVSYSNSRFSTGGVYVKNKFIPKESSDRLSYYYTDGFKRFFRTRCQTRLLSVDVLSLKLSEVQYADLGYFGEILLGKKTRLYKVFNYGQLKWVLRPKLLSDDRKYFIYKHVNIANGKTYIGYTDNMERREIQHTTERTSALYDDYVKYGHDAFKYELIEEVIGLSAVKKREIELIAEYDTYNNGYNRTYGGEGSCVSKKLVPEDILKIRDLLTENKLTNQKIADMFDVSEGFIRSIGYGNVWRSVVSGRIPRKKVSAKGENQGSSILTEDVVIQIKTRVMKGESKASIARSLNQKVTTIEAVASGRNWGHVVVDGFNPDSHKDTKNANILNEDIVRKIKKLFGTGITNAEIARQFGVSKVTIGNIAKGTSWGSVKI